VLVALVLPVAEPLVGEIEVTGVVAVAEQDAVTAGPSTVNWMSAVSWLLPVTVYDRVCDPSAADIGEPSSSIKVAVRSSQLPLMLQVMVNVTLSPTAKPTIVLLP
jgi:hypothetical protein